MPPTKIGAFLRQRAMRHPLRPLLKRLGLGVPAAAHRPSRSPPEADPLLEYLLGFRQRMGQARRLLTDIDKTAFFFVTLPEALPIAVITRFIGWFHEFGIPVGGVIVNMVIDRQAVGSDVPEFVLNRMRMQDDHMVTIREKFDGRVRAVVPLFDDEVRGTAMLGRAAAALFD